MPGRKGGGTTLTFRLSRPTVLRITIVRVYPSCKRLGSFTVRAHAGVNRVRFRGRLRGRPLPAGGYRLVVRARGAQRDAAAVPIVIARGKTSKAEIRKARTRSMCSNPVADIGLPANDSSGTQAPGSGRRRVDAIKDPIVGALSAVAGTAKSLVDGVTGAADGSPFDDPFVLTVIALLLAAVALLATLLLAQIVRVSMREDLGRR
jgi:hypothetical protein